MIAECRHAGKMTSQTFFWDEADTRSRGEPVSRVMPRPDLFSSRQLCTVADELNQAGCQVRWSILQQLHKQRQLT